MICMHNSRYSILWLCLTPAANTNHEFGIDVQTKILWKADAGASIHNNATVRAQGIEQSDSS